MRRRNPLRLVIQHMHRCAIGKGSERRIGFVGRTDHSALRMPAEVIHITPHKLRFMLRRTRQYVGNAVEQYRARGVEHRLRNVFVAGGGDEFGELLGGVFHGMVFAVGGNWWLLVAGLSVKISFVISEFTAAKIETVAAFTYNLNSKQRDGRLIVKIHTDLSRFPYLLREFQVPQHEPAILVLKDGTVFRGVSIGAAGQSAGEVVFNTSMTGYQEILTDPSYFGQIVTMTTPQIGNYGVNEDDFESARPHVAGFVVRELSPIVSNWNKSCLSPLIN